MRQWNISELGAQGLGARARSIIATGVLLSLSLQGFAQDVVIQSISGNGVLTWSNSVIGGAARVEWAPALGQSWRTTWELLTDIPVTNNIMSKPVPMFYRVVSYTLPVQMITNLTAAVGLSVLTNRLAESNFVVLDVRTPSEYSSGHVKTALNVNYYSSAFQQTLIKFDRKCAYMIYCGSGTRSAAVREVMRGLDFMEVYSLTQGYSTIAAQPGASAYLE